MAFEFIEFPYFPMKHGIRKEIIDPVNIVSNGAYEYRIKRQSWERYKWTLPVQTMTNEQKEDIKSFLLQRSHSLNSFRFVDPDTPAWVDARLAYYSADYVKITTPFDMLSQSVPGTHPLFNTYTFDVTSLTFNDIPWTFTGERTIVNGIPVFGITGGSMAPSDVIRVSGKMYYTVRLNSTVSYALAALDTNNETLGVQHAAIELIEVFGEY